MKTPKTKAKAANVAVPQSRAQAAQFLHDIGVKQRMLARIEADMNDTIAAEKQRAEHLAAPHRLALDALTEGLRVWCDAHRDELTEGGKRKSADLGTGEVEWRNAPAKVTIRGVDAVIEAIRARGGNLAKRFLREKVEIDKEAMRRDRDTAETIPGVTIGSEGESFYVKPFEAEIEGAE